MSFDHNKAADLKIDFKITKNNKISECSDIKDIAEWIKSEEEDFLSKF